jgi:hypothetical protein
MTRFATKCLDCGHLSRAVTHRRLAIADVCVSCLGGHVEVRDLEAGEQDLRDASTYEMSRPLEDTSLKTAFNEGRASCPCRKQPPRHNFGEVK